MDDDEIWVTADKWFISEWTPDQLIVKRNLSHNADT